MINTLPEDDFKKPDRIMFDLTPKKCSSLQEIKFQNFQFSDSERNKMRTYSKGRNSNIMSVYFREKRSKIKFLIFSLTDLLLPNLVVTGIIFLFNFIQEHDQNQFEYCIPEDNFWLLAFYVFKYSFFTLMFYYLLGYLVLFSCMIQCLPNKVQRKIKIILFFFGVSVNFIMTTLKAFKIGLIFIDFDIYFINFFFVSFAFFYILKKYKLPFYKFRSYYFITFSLLFMLSIDYYLIKNYVILNLYLILINYMFGKVLFQILIFIYFQILGRFIKFLMIQFLKTLHFSFKSTDSILAFVKYYMLEALTSSLIVPLVYDGHYLENLFGMINFGYQLLSFYEENIILNLIKKILNFFFPYKSIGLNSNFYEKKCQSFISGSSLEVTIILFLRLAVIIYSKRFLSRIQAYVFIGLVQNCSLILNETIIFLPENLLVLIGLNYLIFSFYVFKFNDKPSDDYVWKLESYNFIQKVYYILLFQFVCDIDLQFYFSLLISSHHH